MSSRLYGGETHRVWTYETSDPYTTIIADGYFDRSKQEFHVYDIINVITTTNGVSSYYRFIVTNIVDTITIEDFPDEGLDLRITDIENGIVNPPPDPGTGTATYTITINNNALNYTVNVNTDFVASRIYITSDDATAPTLSTQGFAETWTGTQQFPSSIYSSNLAGYSAAEAIRAWAYNPSTTTWVKADAGVNDNGSGAIDVTAAENEAPTVTLTLSLGDDPYTEIDWIATVADSKSGVKTDSYQIQDVSAGGQLVLSPTVLTGTLSNQTPGSTRVLMFRALDNQFNEGFSAPKEITLDTPIGLTAPGTINFTASSYTFDEGTVGTVNFTLSGNEDGFDKSVTVSTRSWTAQSGVVVTFGTTAGVTDGTDTITTSAAHGLSTGQKFMYDADGGVEDIGLVDGDSYWAIVVDSTNLKPASSAANAAAGTAINITGTGAETHRIITGDFEVLSSQTVTVDPAVGNVDLSIHIPDQDATLNNIFELYIDYGSGSSESTGDAPVVGSTDAILILIAGTGEASSGALQENAGGDVVVDFDLTGWSFTQGPLNGENFVLDDYTGLTSDSGADVPAAIITVDKSPSMIPSYVSLVNNNSWFTASALVGIQFEAASAGNKYIWVRAMQTSGARSLYACIDSSSSSSSYIYFNQPVNTWGWFPVSAGGGSTPTAFNVSAGVHTLYLGNRESALALYINRVIVSDDASFVPTDLDDTISAAGTSVVTDNPDNPEFPIGPTTGTVTPTSITPADGSTDERNNTTIAVSWGAVTDIVVNTSIISVLSDGNPVSGTWTSNGVNGMTFQLSSGTVFADGATVTLDPFETVIGSVRNADQTYSAITLGAAGSWSIDIETITSNPADVYRPDFTLVTGVPRSYTVADAVNVFDTEDWNYFNSLTWINDAAAGRKALRMHPPAGTTTRNYWQTRTYGTGTAGALSSSSPTALYTALTFRINSGFQPPSSLHMAPIVMSSDDRITHGAGGAATIAASKWAVRPNMYNNASWNRGDYLLGLYCYLGRLGTSRMIDYLCNTLTPGINSAVGTAGLPGWLLCPRDVVCTLSWYQQRNTFTGATAHSDGILQAWFQVQGGPVQHVIDRSDIMWCEALESPDRGLDTIINEIYYSTTGASSLLPGANDILDMFDIIVSASPILPGTAV